jgi:sensor histidine kinase YesM
LDNKSNELITLEEELKFISSYAYLLNIRYSPNLKIELHISDESKHLLLPPLAIQLLIENAIKHNEISSGSPLLIELKSTEKTMVISNKINRRISEEPSSKTGLKNIQKRYSYFTDLQISVDDSEGIFKVEIPLLKEV